ncbi:YfhO family protein [Neobacillus sp. Marseille-QA0830]
MKNLFNRSGGYLLAFLLPFILLGGVFAVWGVYPFGDRSILMSDQFTQYIPFYQHYYDILKGKGSFFYAWEAGMGTNFWGTFAYYLASPLSPIVLLFNQKHLPEAFIIMTLAKVGLSGLFMYLFLSLQFKSERTIKWTFSTFYALISFSIGYFFNIMWLDSIYMLPLVLLGVERLFRKKYLLFLFSLSILFISNFYMAYITGLFTFLYFVLRNFLESNSNWKVILLRFFSFFACVFAAGGISAFVTVPTYLLLKVNDQPANWSGALQPAFGFFEFIAKLYNGSINLLTMPNVFCGLLVLLLVPLFFSSPKINSREKIVYFLLLCILFLSFQIDGLNYIWHAFEKPSGYLQRFAFVFSFMLIFLAFRAFLVFEKENFPSLLKTYSGHVFLIMILTALVPESMSIRKALINISLLTLYSLILYGKIVVVPKKQHYIAMLLLFSACLDMGFNAYSHVKTLNSYLGYSFTRNQFELKSSDFIQLINDLNKKDKGFYRIGTAMSLPWDKSQEYRHFTGDVPIDVNESLLYRYKGMSNFNTLSNGTLHQFMNRLGYSSTLGSRSLTQNKGILTSDSLFSFKYLITDQPINKHGYEKVRCKETACLYRNINAMPIGFMMDDIPTAIQVESKNSFEVQNHFLGPKGTNIDYFVPIKAINIQYHNVEINNNGGMQYVKKIDAQQEGYMEMTFDVKGEKQLYTLMSLGNGFNQTKVYVNGGSFGLYPTYHNDQVLELGAFTDETVKMRVEFLTQETVLSNQLFYALDIPKFEQRINELKSNSLKIKSWSDTSIQGTINAKKSNTLFLSIPYDKGWNASIDGRKMPVRHLGGFIGLNVQSGKHNVKLSYSVPGLKIGIIITVLSFIGVIGAFLIRRRIYRKIIPD